MALDFFSSTYPWGWSGAAGQPALHAPPAGRQPAAAGHARLPVAGTGHGGAIARAGESGPALGAGAGLVRRGAASLALYTGAALPGTAVLFPTQGVLPVCALACGAICSRPGSTSMPFLVPLLPQVGLGHSPLQAGLWLLPMVAAGMAVKTWRCPWCGASYRRCCATATRWPGVWAW